MRRLARPAYSVAAIESFLCFEGTLEDRLVAEGRLGIAIDDEGRDRRQRWLAAAGQGGGRCRRGAGRACCADPQRLRQSRLRPAGDRAGAGALGRALRRWCGRRAIESDGDDLLRAPLRMPRLSAPRAARPGAARRLPVPPGRDGALTRPGQRARRAKPMLPDRRSEVPPRVGATKPLENHDDETSNQSRTSDRPQGRLWSTRLWRQRLDLVQCHSLVNPNANVSGHPEKREKSLTERLTI